MAQSFRHHFHRVAGGDEQAGMGVAQVVEPDVRQTRTGDDPGEQLTDRLQVQGFAVSVGEYRVARTNAVPIVALTIAPSCEDVFGVGVEFEAPSTGAGLGGELGRSPGECLASAADRQLVQAGIPVTPAQATGQFAKKTGARRTLNSLSIHLLRRRS